MAKTAPLKRKGQSIYSRAAKRASSLSIDADKSLKNVNPPVESSNFLPSILAIRHGAGITKRSKHGRKSVPSSKAKRRQERGLNRAEAFMDKRQKKIERSRGKSKTIQERSKAWDELNQKIVAKRTREESSALGRQGWVDDKNEERGEDIEFDDIVVNGVKDLDVRDAPSGDIVKVSISRDATEENEEIL